MEENGGWTILKDKKDQWRSGSAELLFLVVGSIPTSGSILMRVSFNGQDGRLMPIMEALCKNTL